MPARKRQHRFRFASLLLALPLFSTPLHAADREPSPFVPAPVARPLVQKAAVSKVTARWADVKKRQVGPAVNNWQLRYRKTPDAVMASVSDSQRAPRLQSNPRARKSGLTPVQFVSQIEPLDPFDDPFGDRRPSMPTELPPASPELPPAPTSNFETRTSTDGVQTERIMERLQEEAQPDTDSAPLPPLELDRTRPQSNCDRIYNERDCCAAEESCKKARNASDILGLSLRDISIDITPRLYAARSATDSGRTYEQELALSLAAVPSRAWRNQNGEVVADGHLADFRDGRVVVRQGDGESVRIPFSELSEDDACFVTAWWNLPSECTITTDDYIGRSFVATTMTWKASSLCHKPLYFEDVQLERYGHSAGPILQPVASGAHFFLNVATLPYKMGINPPNECRYALGYYRPGNCAPWLLPPVPLSVRGALAQAGTIVGGVFVIP